MKNKKKKQLLHNYLKECAENRGIANIKRFDDYEGKVIKYFETTKSSIEKEITFIISKIADDNKLSFSEAKKLLNSEELKTFRLNLSEYLDRDRYSLSDNVIKFIENYQSIQRISKLQSMNVHLTVEVDKLFNKYKDGTTEYLTEAYKSNYYHSIYDLQRVTSFSKMIKPSSSKIAIALSKSWVSDNLKYNERIDKNRNYLINELQTELAQTLTTGVNIDEAVKRLSKKLDISKNSAVNLIQSELTAISSNAELDSYKELGIDRYENIATLDTRTSAKCREMDGTVFATSDFEPGVTASPFHWRCRSTTAPYYEKILQGTRAARDSEGNSILASSDMKYQEWYDKYVVEARERDAESLIGIKVTTKW